MALLVQGYGMTETCGIISLEWPEKGQARQFGSTGSLVSGVEAKIVDIETLKCLPPNELGEICVRGPNIMQGKILIIDCLYCVFILSPYHQLLNITKPSQKYYTGL